MSTDDFSLDYLYALSDVLSISKLVLFALSVGLLLLLSKSLKLLSERLCHLLPTKRILIFQVTTILTFALHIFGTVYIIYGLLKPPQELMLALLGSATFAIGLSLKDLVGSLISGITLILDPPFQVGDRVKFKDIYGEIKKIGLRAVRLQTLDMEIVTIPNLSFMNEAVICANVGALNMTVCTKFYLSLDNDLRQVRRLLREIVVTSRYAYLNEPIILVVDKVWRIETLCFEITVKANVLDARYEKEFQTDLLMRGTKAMIEHGIKFPEKFPTGLAGDINKPDIQTIKESPKIAA